LNCSVVKWWLLPCHYKSLTFYCINGCYCQDGISELHVLSELPGYAAVGHVAVCLLIIRNCFMQVWWVVCAQHAVYNLSAFRYFPIFDSNFVLSFEGNIIYLYIVFQCKEQCEFVGTSKELIVLKMEEVVPVSLELLPKERSAVTLQLHLCICVCIE
jgi:hypothetical protein